MGSENQAWRMAWSQPSSTSLPLSLTSANGERQSNPTAVADTCEKFLLVSLVRHQLCLSHQRQCYQLCWLLLMAVLPTVLVVPDRTLPAVSGGPGERASCCGRNTSNGVGCA